jgi:hypothetical protein
VAGSVDLPCHGRAGTVYSSGLRRCLIIFAPQALILDRRTNPCRAPSLRLVPQRSKNFTSGAAIPSTPSSPLAVGGIQWPVTGHRGSEDTPRCACPRPSTTIALGQGAPRSAQLHCHTRSMHCHSMERHSARIGCFGHTEFSTVTVTVGSGGGPGERHVAAPTDLWPPEAPHAVGVESLWAPSEGDF